MNVNIIQPLAWLAFGLLVAWVVPIVLSGNLFPLMIIAGLVMVVFLNSLKPVWFGVILGAMTISVTIPLPILEKLSVAYLIAAGITLIVIIESLVQKKQESLGVFVGWEAKLMIFATLIIALRFIYDRPFSAELGTRGGGAQAVYFLLGAIAYFSMVKVAAKKFDLKINLKVLVVILIISFAVDMVNDRLLPLMALGFTHGYLDLLKGFFWGPIWFLCPLLLATFMKKYGVTKSIWQEFAVIAITGMTIFLGVTSVFRSRPYIAILLILLVAYFLREMKKMAVIVGIFFTIIIASMLTGFINVPDTTLRAMSTIVPIEDEAKARLYGETGWTYNFRWTLFEYAWEDIKSSPLYGVGFSYSDAALESSFISPHKVGARGTMEGLILSGIYHNSILQLASRCGVPCALAFLLALILSVRRYFYCVKDSAHNQFQVINISIFSFLVANIIQMLMNGSGQDFFNICILMGIMRGLSIRDKITLDVTKERASQITISK